MDYFEQMIYDDGTYQVWQCQKRGYIPCFKLHKPVKVFGMRFCCEALLVGTLITWSDDVKAIKTKLKQIKSFPSEVVEFTLEE